MKTNNRKIKGKSISWMLVFVIFSSVAFSLAWTTVRKPSLFIIGDSTVRNGDGRGNNGLWGWGDCIAPLFDTVKIHIENHARGGRSSRTYITEGLWEQVVSQIKPGDYLIMQFGHNDGGSLDTGRARASLPGNGGEIKSIIIKASGKPEVVHTYGWYIRKYIADARAKGAEVIVCSPIPRNIWKDGKVARATNDYTQWAREAAHSGGAFFIDLNEISSRHFEEIGQETIKTQYFLKDHTHTTLVGAKLNATSVVEGLRKIHGCSLNKYLNN